MQFIREKLTGPVTPEAEVSLNGALQEQFRPVVAGARREVSRLLDLQGRRDPVGGDVVYTPEGELLYYQVSPGRDEIVAGAAWPSGARSQHWDAFRTLIAQALGTGDWGPSPLVSRAFQMLREEAAPLQVGDKERKAAQALASPTIRRLLHVITQTPGIPLQQAAEGRGLGEVTRDVDDLGELGLVAREFEVFCRSTDQKISRVTSLAALDDAAGRGFKCIYCGRAISDEQILQLLTVTPEGVRLSQPNVWLAMLLGGLLLDQGVDPARILWRHEPDHRIVEVFADVEGSMVMFEVQEDGVSADSVFRFLSRASFFAPDAGFLVTPNPAPGKARRVLEGREGNLRILDDLSTLGEELAAALEDTSHRVIGRLMEDFVPRTRISLDRLMGDYFLGAAQICPSPSAPVAGSMVAPRLAEEPAAPVQEARKTPDPMEPAEASSQPEAQVAPVQEPAVAEATPIQEEPGPVEAEVDPAALEVPPPDLPALIGDFAQEIIPGPVALVGEDQEDVLEALVSRILATLKESGLAEGDEELQERLREVSELDECSAMLADSDGMIFLGEMDTVDEPDLVAAYHVDLVNSLRGALEDANLGILEGILMDGGSSRLQVYPAVEGVSLVVHSGRAATEHEEEVGPSSPGEMALREAILKKALEGLVRLDGVRGSLVSQREGLPIEFILPGDLDAELVASLLSQGLSECEHFLEQLGMGPLRQALLHAGGAWYSLIPLGAEGVLVTVLEPETLRETWLHRLGREARMMASVLN